MLHPHLDLEASIRQFGQSQTETAVWLEKTGVGISPEAPSVPGTDKWQETTCMVVRFRGSHQDAPAQYKTLLQFIRDHSLSATDFSRDLAAYFSRISSSLHAFLFWTSSTEPQYSHFFNPSF